MDADDDLTLGPATSDEPGDAWLGRRQQLMDLIHNQSRIYSQRTTPRALEFAAAFANEPQFKVTVPLPTWAGS